MKKLLRLEPSKIKSEPLKKEILGFIKNYISESDKEAFKTAHKENIKKLYEMVERFEPQAIPKAEESTDVSANKKSEQEKSPTWLKRGLVKAGIGELRTLAERAKQTATTDVEGILINTADDLEKALGEQDDSKQDDNKLANKVSQALQPYRSWEKIIEENQRLRHGYVDQDDKKIRAELGALVAKLVSELGISRKTTPRDERVIKKDSSTSTTLLTKELVHEVVAEITATGIDLEDEDEQIVASLRAELKEATGESAHAQFRKKTQQVVDENKDAFANIDNKEGRKEVITSFNKLLDALGETPLNPSGKEKKESDQERSKRILKELEALKPELEHCRAIVNEANRKKRDTKGKKPKANRYTRLKTKLLSIASLIPPALKENRDVQKHTESILLTTHKELVREWGMDKIKARSGIKAIKEKFDQIEEKLDKKQSNQD